MKSLVGQVDLANMAEQVNVQDAKTRLSELLVRAEAGEEIVIARGGKPVARLALIGEPQAREVGFVPAIELPDAFFEELPDDELRSWEGR